MFNRGPPHGPARQRRSSKGQRLGLMPARHLRFEITFRGSRTVVKNGQIMTGRPASRLPAGALDSADRVAIRPFSLLAATPTSSLTRARMRMTIINWDHLIGDGEQRLRYGDAQQPCGL